MSYQQPEVSEQTLALTETCLEGLLHMQSQLEQGLHEASLQLYCNVLEAVVQVEASVHFALKEEEQVELLDQWTVIREQLSSRMAEIANAYQAFDWNAILPQLKLAIPEFKVWQETVYVHMSPKYLV